MKKLITTAFLLMALANVSAYKAQNKVFKRIALNVFLIYWLAGCAANFSANVDVEAISDLGQTVFFQNGKKYINHTREDIGLASTISVEEFIRGKIPIVRLRLGLQNISSRNITVSINDIYSRSEFGFYSPAMRASEYVSRVRSRQSGERFNLAMQGLSASLEETSLQQEARYSRSRTTGSIGDDSVDLTTTSNQPNQAILLLARENSQRQIEIQTQVGNLDSELLNIDERYFKIHTLTPDERYIKDFSIELTPEILEINFGTQDKGILLLSGSFRPNDNENWEPFLWELHFTEISY